MASEVPEPGLKGGLKGAEPGGPGGPGTTIRQLLLHHRAPQSPPGRRRTPGPEASGARRRHRIWRYANTRRKFIQRYCRAGDTVAEATALPNQFQTG